MVGRAGRDAQAPQTTFRELLGDRMLPKDLRYARSHEWVRVEGDVATVGITAFAVEQLTDPVAIDFKPKVGGRIEAEKPFGEIESVKAVSDLYAPVTGEVVEINEAVRNDPGLITPDPFGKGWMLKVRLSDRAQIDQLLTAEQYAQQIASQGH